MKNYIQDGKSMTVPAPTGGSVSGVGVLAGTLFGIASTTEAAGDDVSICTEGVFDHAKTSAQAWTLGAAIYWDDTNKVMTTTASSNTLVGKAAAVAANPSATGRVRLNG